MERLGISIFSLLVLLACWRQASAAMVVCYYGAWATYRTGNGKVDVSNIDPTLCTHIIYSFAGLDSATNKITSLDTNLDFTPGKNAIANFVGLKKNNPNLKVILAIGGWNEGSVKYSNMAASASKRSTFISSVVSYLKTYGFDGFDVDWEYPANNGGAAADKQNYVSLLKELKAAFAPYGYSLSVAVGAGKSTIDSAYDVPGVSSAVDFINIMAYDLHGAWEASTGHVAPLYARPDESGDNKVLNVDYAIKYWISLGAAPSKLVLGIPLYGVSYTLANANNNGLYAPASGPGAQGPYTQQNGFLGYNEIMEAFNTGGWTVVRDSVSRVPRAYKGNQWVGYDDVTSVTEKCNYATSMNLAGAMVWSLETDDVYGASGTKYPLLKAINAAVSSGSSSDTTTGATTTTTQPTTTTTAQTTTTTKSTTTKATTTTTAPTTTSTAATTTTTAGTDPGLGGSGTGTDKQSYLVSRCPEGKALRDPDNPNTFYQCVSDGKGSYNLFSFNCSPGLVFNEASQSCDWP